MQRYREQIETALEKGEEVNPQHVEGVKQICLTATRYLGINLAAEIEAPLMHDKPAQKLRIKDLAEYKLNI